MAEREVGKGCFLWCPVIGIEEMATNWNTGDSVLTSENTFLLFFSVQVTKKWHGLPKGVVESSSLEIFKSCLDMILCKQVYVALLDQGDRWDDLEVPSNFSSSVILWYSSDSPFPEDWVNRVKSFTLCLLLLKTYMILIYCTLKLKNNIYFSVQYIYSRFDYIFN